MAKFDDSIRVFLQRRDGSDNYDELHKWVEYSVKMGFRNPIHTFHLIHAPSPAVRQLISPWGGQRVIVRHGDDLQTTGVTVERSKSKVRGNMDLQITGISTLGVPAQSAIPLKHLSLRGSSLANRASTWLGPWMEDERKPDYIPGIMINGAASRYVMAGALPKRDKIPKPKGSNPQSGVLDVVPIPGGAGSNAFKLINFVPPPATGPAKKRRTYKKFGKHSPLYLGTHTEELRKTRLGKDARILPSLQLYAEQVGVNVWQGVDGTVILSRPSYDFDPTAYGDGIVAEYEEGVGLTGGNCKSTNLDTSTKNRHGRYRIASPVKLKKGDLAKFHLRYIDDPGRAFWVRNVNGGRLFDSAGQPVRNVHKPGRIDAGSRNYDKKVISRIARSRMLERLLGGISLKYHLFGHLAPSGVHWCHDSMVSVLDQENYIDQAMFIDNVELRYTRGEGKTSVLTVFPPDMWLGKYDLEEISVAEFNAELSLKCWW